MDSISVYSNTLCLSNVDTGSSLRWLSASTMTWWRHFDSISDPEPQNLSQVRGGEMCKAATICLWTAYQYPQTLCICLIWIWVAVYNSQDRWNNYSKQVRQPIQSYGGTRRDPAQGGATMVHTGQDDTANAKLPAQMSYTSTNQTNQTPHSETPPALREIRQSIHPEMAHPGNMRGGERNGDKQGDVLTIRGGKEDMGGLKLTQRQWQTYTSTPSPNLQPLSHSQRAQNTTLIKTQ